jgi:5-methyltetrahydropteroyltriglutamate--homocysteine methyltransferase
MLTSEERILTTHAGSLPRPPELTKLMVARESGALDTMQTKRLSDLVRDAVNAVLRRQGDSGIDVGSDGEQSKIGYATYVKERMSGFEGGSGALSLADLEDYPEITERALTGLVTATPSCTGPVRYTGLKELREELGALRAAVDAARAAGTAPAEIFVPAASPGVIAIYLTNQYYDSDESYLGP